ncbi:hypothetical protein [Actinoplanes sp. RD1]|uniref:hypothetical protein n=1 Tax=Actinoplanes sp. RD1 TaxID=3064538 RepID=UPI00274215F7|nr:hypothetical protein [Actinoplanes sp. RD1]
MRATRRTDERIPSQRTTPAREPARAAGVPLGALELQRLIGNRATGEVLRGGPAPATAAPVVQRVLGPDDDPQQLMTDRYWREKHKTELLKAGPSGSGKAKKGAKAVSPEKAADQTLTDLKTDSKFWNDKGRKPKGGNKRRAEDVAAEVGQALLAEIAKRAADGDTGRLKVFRAMTPEEATAILAWAPIRPAVEAKIAAGTTMEQLRADYGDDSFVVPVKNHLGDVGQVGNYFADAGAAAGNKMLEFTIKPGAAELLFSPDYMAPAASGKGATRNLVAMGERSGQPYKTSSGNEGVLPGYIGMKPEQHGDFSLSLGDNNATQLLFQLFLEGVRDVSAEHGGQ